MKKILLFTLLTFCLSISYGQGKRGIAYGYHSPEDLGVLAPNVSWWYNWSEVPESTVSSVFQNYGFEFVPMTWNGNFDETKLINFLTNHPETKYILGFNEPNFLEQANMTPSQAAAIWPQVEAIADQFDLEIVSPAVNFCGNCVTENGTTYYSPFDYLDDFFEACQGCRVDHIAVHSYMNTVGALEWYINQFKAYNKPIWVTEFAGWEDNGNITNMNDQINYMVGAVDFFEGDTSIYRYSWFIGRGDGVNNYPHIDLLGANGVLTPVGEIYTQMPTHDPDHVVDIPALIEAEAYNKMQGILLELTEDETGFANVGWIDFGDWLEYKINVPADGTYPISFRIASTANSNLSVLVDGAVALTQNFGNSNGWQNWETYENTIELTEGVHTIRLRAGSGGFNINWFQIGDISTNLSNVNSETENLKIFPNPANDILNIQLEKWEDCIVRISDMTGRLVYQNTLSVSGAIDISNLVAGMYMVNVSTDEFSISKKIIKN